MKTFEDLEFVPHYVYSGLPENASVLYPNLISADFPARQAKLEFDNGYKVSVIQGPMFYTDNKDEYEVGMFKGDTLCYDLPMDGDVMGHLSKDEVTELMTKIQRLEKVEKE